MQDSVQKDGNNGKTHSENGRRRARVYCETELEGLRRKNETIVEEISIREKATAISPIRAKRYNYQYTQLTYYLI